MIVYIIMINKHTNSEQTRTAADAHTEDLADMAWINEGHESGKVGDFYVQAGQLALEEYLERNNGSNVMGNPQAPTPSVAKHPSSEK